MVVQHVLSNRRDLCHLSPANAVKNNQFEKILRRATTIDVNSSLIICNSTGSDIKKFISNRPKYQND